MDDSLPTYLIAIGKKSTITALENEITKHDGFDSNELLTKELSSESKILYMGKSVCRNLKNSEGTEFFSGWMNDHHNRSIYLGQRGFEAAENQHARKNLNQKEGAFIHSYWDGQTFRLQHDCFGLYPILSFHERDVFVASDSLLCLTKIRTVLKLENVVDEKAHTSRFWKHGLAKSIMSTAAVVKGIEYLPPASSVTVEQVHDAGRDFQLKVKKNIPKMPTVFDLKKTSYNDILIRSFRQIVGTIHAIQSIDGIKIELGLSGGLDSRVLLAVLRYKSQLPDNISIRSNTHSSRSKDIRIVKQMSHALNFKFNETIDNNDSTLPKPQRIKVTNMFGNWALTNLGIFDMMYMYDSYWEHPYKIQLGGHGAEIVKGTFAKLSFFKIAFRYRTPMRYLRLRKELKAALRSVGVPFRFKNKLQWHHLCYKSAIQNGRSLSQSLLTLRPFMNKTMCSYSLKNPENNLIQDLLILLDTDLATFPFDEEKKNMSFSYVESRKKELSSISIPKVATPYRVYGGVHDIQNGLLESLLEYGNGFQIDSCSTRESLLEKLQTTWEGIESPDAHYREVFDTARQELSKENAYIPNAGSNASKIMTVKLFD